MKIIALIFCLCLPAVASEVDHVRLLNAIAMVETGGNVRPGKAGERGAHQMTGAARRDNGTPERHLSWLERNLPNPTPYRLALAWNAGLTRTIEHRALSRHHDYAQRVLNLYNDATPSR